jgi:hypothetical protein
MCAGKDLNPELPTFPATLGDLMDMLKGWRARISSELEDKVREVGRDGVKGREAVMEIKTGV